MTQIDQASEFLVELLSALASLPERHATHDPIWRALNYGVATAIKVCFGKDTLQEVEFGPFGKLVFPYTVMGSIDSCDLFGLDELIMFAFYSQNAHRYRTVVDFGANIGLHSFVMSRCGFEVQSFEPDPHHADMFRRTMRLNHISPNLHQAAVSLVDGEQEFTRVRGNTTGSHLSGAKDAPYGELDRFMVQVAAAEPYLRRADFAKIDIEGHEAELLTKLPLDIWAATDAMVEVGNAQNAALIFRHFDGTSVNLFAQKLGWGIVRSVENIPTSHREGSLFISSKNTMPWKN